MITKNKIQNKTPKLKVKFSKEDYERWENPEVPFLTGDEIRAAKTPEERKALFERPIRTAKVNPNLVIELI